MADLFFSLSPTVLLGVFREKSSRVAPMEIRPPGFLIRSWSQEMWFRPLLGGGCVDSTDGAEQTDGRNLPPENDPDGNRTPDLPLVGRALLSTN